MKRTNIIISFLFIIVITLIIWGCTKDTKNPNVVILPNLPYPIAKEPVLITSAGQGPEGLIVSKMSDKLKIINKYRYKAETTDLQDVGCLLIVGGISHEGLKAAFTTLEEDQARILSMLVEAKYKKIPVVAVFPGGKVRRTKLDDKLAEKIIAQANYVIALREADEDYFFSKSAEKYNYKLTLKRTLREIPVALNSVFR